MSIRQRQMYETAFDSRVKREVYDIDRLVQSPVLQHEPVVRHRIGSGSGLRPRLGARGVPGSSRGSSANSSPRDSRESPRHRSMTVQHFTPTEKRKVTLIRDSPRSLSPQPQKIKVNDVSRPSPPTDISWMVENSSRRRSAVGGISNTQGKQIHKNTVDSINQVLNPGSSEGITNGFQAENGSSGEKKTFSPTTEFKKLDILTAYESDSVPNADGIIGNSQPVSKEAIENFAMTSTEPYRQPMKDHANLPCPNGLLSSFKPSLSSNTNPFRLSSHTLRHNSPNSAHQFQLPMDAPSFSLTGQMSNGTTDEANSSSTSVKRQVPAVKSSGVPARPNLSLNFNSSPKRARQHLSLNFGCAALNVIGETIDPSIPLEKQGWYHGSISRLDAENVIRLLKEGSYLVRNCESSRHDHFLSLKSARGFMHMKIVSLDGKYILGQGNQPFDSVPCMVHYYSIHRLPIKGAEHMVLLHPVMDQLL